MKKNNPYQKKILSHEKNLLWKAKIHKFKKEMATL